MYDITWPDTHAYRVEVTASSVVGRSITVELVDNTFTRRPRVARQVYPGGDASTFVYDGASTFAYGPGATLTTASDTTVISTNRGHHRGVDLSP